MIRQINRLQALRLALVLKRIRQREQLGTHERMILCFTLLPGNDAVSPRSSRLKVRARVSQLLHFLCRTLGQLAQPRSSLQSIRNFCRRNFVVSVCQFLTRSCIGSQPLHPLCSRGPKRFIVRIRLLFGLRAPSRRSVQPARNRGFGSRTCELGRNPSLTFLPLLRQVRFACLRATRKPIRKPRQRPFPECNRSKILHRLRFGTPSLTLQNQALVLRLVQRLLYFPDDPVSTIPALHFLLINVALCGWLCSVCAGRHSR